MVLHIGPLCPLWSSIKSKYLHERNDIDQPKIVIILDSSSEIGHPISINIKYPKVPPTKFQVMLFSHREKRQSPCVLWLGFKIKFPRRAFLLLHSRPPAVGFHLFSSFLFHLLGPIVAPLNLLLILLEFSRATHLSVSPSDIDPEVIHVQ